MPPATKRTGSSSQPELALSAKTPTLSALLDHAARLRRVDLQLRLQLAWPESAEFVLANVRSGTLVLTTTLAPVAARLRLEQTRILESASRAWGSPLGKLLIKTIPSRVATAKPAPKTLSQSAALHLQAAAQAAFDPELSELMLKLARSPP